MTDEFQARKAQASTWFCDLRGQIVSAFEALEDSHGTGTPGRFEISQTVRADGGGGVM